MIVTLLRKPLTGTIIQTLTEFGGGMNIDASRVGTTGGMSERMVAPQVSPIYGYGLVGKKCRTLLSQGYYPCNLVSLGIPVHRCVKQVVQ